MCWCPPPPAPHRALRLPAPVPMRRTCGAHPVHVLHSPCVSWATTTARWYRRTSGVMGVRDALAERGWASVIEDGVSAVSSNMSPRGLRYGGEGWLVRSFF